MTELKELLAKATPGRPWNYDYNAPKDIIAEDGSGAFVMRLGDARVFSYAVQMSKNVDLALYAVNHLPDYLAVVEAAQRAADALPGHLPPGVQGPVNDLRAALARLREQEADR